MIAGVLGANSSWADPVIFNVDAHLKDDLDGGPAADRAVFHLNAALLPSVDHLVLTDPLIGEHDAVVRLLVQIDDILEADIETFMVTAKSAKFVVRFRSRELSKEGMTIMHLNGLAMEEVHEVDIANLVMLDIDAHVLQDFIHVFLADELLIHLEAATVMERIV